MKIFFFKMWLTFKSVNFEYSRCGWVSSHQLNISKDKDWDPGTSSNRGLLSATEKCASKPWESMSNAGGQSEKSAYCIIWTAWHSGKGETTGTKNKSVVSRACSEKRVGQQRNKEDIFHGWYSCLMGLPGGSVMKNPPASAEDAGSISGLGRSPGKGNANLL